MRRSFGVASKTAEGVLDEDDAFSHSCGADTASPSVLRSGSARRSRGTDNGDNALGGTEIPKCPNCLPYTGAPDEFMTNDWVSHFINSGGLNPRSLFKSGVATIGSGVMNRIVSPEPLKLLHPVESMSKNTLEYHGKKGRQGDH